ncbi:MAG: ATP-grasp domain-containing protein [Gemmataceae bacterium]|nr:ATP-grasp domain-containing protein [Gemmataceae bacterium]
MLRIFVYEYTCAHDIGNASLATEGWAMLDAVMRDFAALTRVEVTTLLATMAAEPAAWPCRRVSKDQEEHAFRREAAAADYTLVVAPELDGILYERCRWVEEAGGRLLGPSSSAVRLTADKLALSQYLRKHGVATPECHLLGMGTMPATFSLPAVLKPRDGAGSQATFLLHESREIADCVAASRQEGWTGELLLQPWVRGLAASVAFLIGAGGFLPLPATAQELSNDGRFHYQGGWTPLPAGLAERATRLARSAVETVPGLRGYVGVDLVLGESADGRGDRVIEVNPRLTTSYVGLRALARENLAEAMLCLVEGREPPPLRWRSGTVHFQADGSVCTR